MDADRETSPGFDCEPASVKEKPPTAPPLLSDVTRQPEKAGEPEVKRRKASRPHKVDSGDESSGSAPSSPASPHPANSNGRPAASGSGSSNMKATGTAGVKNHDFELEMDLSQPLSSLIRALQPQLNFDLATASVYLCGIQKLSQESCLKDCVRDGSRGMVKVKVVVTTGGQRARLNILDVLQQAPEVIPTGATTKPKAAGGRGKVKSNEPASVAKKARLAENQKPGWLPSESFRLLTQTQGFSQDPAEWSVADVGHWLSWAPDNFSLPELNMQLFSDMDGAHLCGLTRDEFAELVGRDDSALFWTHFEQLRTSQQALVPAAASTKKQPRATPVVKRTMVPKNLLLFTKESSGTIQLWQFLLELLASGNYTDCLEWAGDEGEFRLINPERVAELWGHRKNKTNMNYEKMSRALRYYYDGEILGKVPGKHFTYKFICDLKDKVGYSIDELLGDGPSSPLHSLPPSTPSSFRDSHTDSDADVDGLVPRFQTKPKNRKSIARRSRLQNSAA